jgi:hypothetical protein
MRIQPDLDGPMSRLVSHHLHNLVAAARRQGLSLEDLTIELATHATCAALSFWTADDLIQIVEAAELENEAASAADLSAMRPVGLA